MSITTETIMDKVTRTLKDSIEAKRRAEVADDNASVAFIAKAGAEAAYNTAYNSKWDLIAVAAKAAKAAAESAAEYIADIESRRLAAQQN